MLLAVLMLENGGAERSALKIPAFDARISNPSLGCSEVVSKSRYPDS
jgi:hypothetical protein